jgi:DNA-binding HxlR family transcriptional regulator
MTMVCEEVSDSMSRVMTLLGKRWTGVIIGTLMQGPVHFNDLRRAIPGISDRVLNERLTELASFDLVTRTVHEGPPLRVQYALTEHGTAMQPAIEELCRWASAHLRTPPTVIRTAPTTAPHPQPSALQPSQLATSS